MRQVLLIGFVALAVSACVNAHFEPAVRLAAAKDSDCGGDVVVRKLNSYAYRAESCGEAKYYRCYFKRRTMGEGQCCYRVSSESTATALFGAKDGDAPEACI